MSSTSNGTSSPSKSEVEGEFVVSRPIRCVCNLLNKKQIQIRSFSMEFCFLLDSDSGNKDYFFSWFFIEVYMLPKPGL